MRRRVSCVLLMAVLAWCHSRGLGAQEQLTANNFNVDMALGPVLAAQRIVAMGGANTALASGIDSTDWNPAAYAARSLWEPNWFEWEISGSLLLPGTFSQNDLYNNRLGEGIGIDDFVFWTAGLRLQFGRLGVGASLRGHHYDLIGEGDERVSVNNGFLNPGAAWMFLEGQLIAGANFRVVTMDFTDSTNTRLVEFSGLGIEGGVILRPAGAPIRFGFSARSPVKSPQVTGEGEEPLEQIRGFVLPSYVYLPWEIQVGAAWQFGERPLNKRWRAPMDPKIRLTREMKRRWCEREFEQALLEMNSDALELPDESNCPRRSYKARDPEWWQAEKERRRKEKTAVNKQIEEERDAVRQDLRDEYGALPRFHWVVSMDFIFVGPVPDGIGLDAFLAQVNRPSGETISVGYRLGTALEPWKNRLKLRAGGYYEPSRNTGVPGRFHITGGLDVRLFAWDLFGWMEPFSVRVGAMVDYSDNYLNWGFGVGFWH